MNQIPSVDLRDFLSDNEQTKSMFVQTIGKAFQEIGFCSASLYPLPFFVTICKILGPSLSLRFFSSFKSLRSSIKSIS